ncbi:UNVERIFIED_CONTAM: hypothetical protein RMT77_009664 [Armadillidium vulgare]
MRKEDNNEYEKQRCNVDEVYERLCFLLKRRVKLYDKFSEMKGLVMEVTELRKCYLEHESVALQAELKAKATADTHGGMSDCYVKNIEEIRCQLIELRDKERIKYKKNLDILKTIVNNNR